MKDILMPVLFLLIGILIGCQVDGLLGNRNPVAFHEHPTVGMQEQIYQEGEVIKDAVDEINDIIEEGE